MLGRLTASLADRYRIERELGQGGMATVYLAHDVRHDRKVALKVLLPDLAAAVGTDRFLREIRTAAGLSHPHILPLYDSGEAAGTLFYAMPLATGESLRERLGREAPLPIEEALQIVRDVAGALSYAHEQGIVHRDIKPENILLSGGHAVVADFGIAAVLGAAGDAKLTGTGMAIGTPTYMSPEQAAGERVDGRSDVYSLGCVLYELLAGTPPFSGPSAQAVVARHLADPVPSIRTVRATVPVALEQVVMKAMAKVPVDRFATASEFGRALPRDVHLLDAGTEALPPSAGTWPRGGRRWAWAAAIGVALVLAVALMARIAGPSGPGEGAIKSLAVLPFRNLTGDTSQLYLAEGATVQLVASLSQIAALRVIQLTNPRGDPATDKALRDNKTDVVLEGFLTSAGNAVRITVQVASARTGQVLPGGRSFDGDRGGILNLQAEVARSVADSIRVSMTPQERSRLTARRRAVSPAAEEAYVRGAFFIGKATPSDVRQGITYFQHAIDLDSSFAAAYAGLALAYGELGYYGAGMPSETYPMGLTAARKAIALDSMLGEAWSARGQVEYAYLWDFAASERDFRRAIALSPRYARGHFNYGMLLTAMNRSAEAIAELRQAQEIDPISLIIHAAAARPFYNARLYDSAVAQSRRTLEIDPTFHRAHYWLGMSYEQMSRPAEAIREFESSIAEAGRLPVYVAALGHAYAVTGQQAKAQLILRELQQRSRSGYVSPYDIAGIYAGLGDRTRAMDWLEKGYTVRAAYMSFLGVDPHFDAFRTDPAFRDLLHRIGLPLPS